MADLSDAVVRFEAAARGFGDAARRCGRQMIVFSVVANNPNASGKKRAFWVRQARRNIRAAQTQ